MNRPPRPPRPDGAWATTARTVRRLARVRPARGTSSDERGIALVATIVICMIVTVLVATIFMQNVQSLPLARQSQNYQAALQAADSGLEDYINRLDSSTDYYSTLDTSNPALETGGSPPGTQWTTWAAVPGTSTNEWFRYAIDSSKAAQTGNLYITVTGAAGAANSAGTGPASAGVAMRTVKYAAHMSGFTNFLYFTDYEIESPQISGMSNSCIYHAWEPNGAGGYGPPSSCSSEFIYFVGESGIQDGLHGPVFSNDELHICGDPSFQQGSVTTAYNQPTTTTGGKYGGAGAYYGDPDCTNSPEWESGAGTQPAGGSAEPFPANNGQMTTDIPASNNGGGCAYKGPIHVTLSVANGVGKMTVTADTVQVNRRTSYTSTVDTSITPSANTCLSPTPVSLPPNGVIYDENGNPNCGSSCNANVTVSGTLAGQLTIGSINDITINGNLTDNSLTGTDMLGLSATEDIVIVPPSNPKTPSGNNGMEIDAAMVAINDSIYVSNWSGIPNDGILYVNGSMAQKFRGPVGTFSSYQGQAYISSGFDKDYTYDSRLQHQQPPYFTSPTLPNWSQTSFTECTATATPSTTTC